MLVAFSHLRWGFVWQRPQHLLTRFAREMPVVVVEEPEYHAYGADFRVHHDHGVTIVTPLLPTDTGKYGFGNHVNRQISQMMESIVPATADPIYWYYTPMALGAEPATVRPRLTVYDAMDDLANFRSAPPELRIREGRLLSQVDLVFTGGPTLYRQRRDKHPSVHCFPSGVEASHFASPKDGSRPESLACRERPILGFYGVIDERLDLPLLAEIADLRPEWTIALIGPVAKIDESTIPEWPNIMRFGQQAYDDLPGFLSCFDVALMPFARNDATRSISPTKTLEYLAGGKPVVSTPITDVIDLYGEVVHIADTASDVVAAAEKVLNRTSEEHRRWRAHAARVVAAHDWDAIAGDMLRVMSRARGTSSLVLPAAQPAVLSA
ncbi:MAG TPA: glycosyltransferase [Thermomicrobiales bacterium]|nr:glycosyltransferase [Thermomicrobiales bacterium]